MAASEQVPASVGFAGLGHGEALGRDVIGRIYWFEDGGHAPFFGEEAEEWRLLVVSPKAGEELGVGEDAAPARADEGGAWEGGWLCREAEEDLLEEVLVVQGGQRRRRRIGAAHTVNQLKSPEAKAS